MKKHKSIKTYNKMKKKKCERERGWKCGKSRFIWNKIPTQYEKLCVCCGCEKCIWRINELVKGLSVRRNVNSSVIESWKIFNALTFINSIHLLYIFTTKTSCQLTLNSLNIFSFFSNPFEDFLLLLVSWSKVLFA